MEKFATGKTKTLEEFEKIVKTQSLHASHNYPFSALIVTDKESDKIAGYEIIGNSLNPNAGETAYLFNKEFHKCDKIKHVGYENIGALIWGYGAKLYEKQVSINKSYNELFKGFHGESIFTAVEAVARTDNIGSLKILRNLGFTEKGIITT